MKHIQSQDDGQMIYHGLLDSLEELDRLDEGLAAMRARHGNPPDRFTPATLSTLIRIILGQQISRAVADTLWQRLHQHNLSNSPELARASYEQLQELGLSRRKSEYIIDIARAEQDGRLDLSALNRASAEDFSAELIQYRGIGSWTISNYRLFCLGDFDAWPGNDLALMEAVRRLRELEYRPSVSMMDKIAQRWTPYRGAAALLLWHLYAVWVRNARPLS